MLTIKNSIVMIVQQQNRPMHRPRPPYRHFDDYYPWSWTRKIQTFIHSAPRRSYLYCLKVLAVLARWLNDAWGRPADHSLFRQMHHARISIRLISLLPSGRVSRSIPLCWLPLRRICWIVRIITRAVTTLVVSGVREMRVRVEIETIDWVY